MDNQKNNDTRRYKNLNKRTITGIVFVLVMLGGVFGGGYAYSLLFLVIAIQCLREFLLLLLPMNTVADKARFYLGVIIGITPYILVGMMKLKWIAPIEIKESYFIYVFPFCFLIFIFELFTYAQKPFHNIAYLFLGLFYIGIPFTLLHYIAFPGGDYSPRFIISLLLITWINDTSAYFLGNTYGKTPLFPRISPKKTWEGSIGGFSIILVLVCILYLFIHDLTFMQWTVLALIIAAAGILGDLVESMLKRSTNVKDSGSLLPGHGGFLDRFDAFIFAIPFAVLFLYWVLNTL